MFETGLISVAFKFADGSFVPGVYFALTAYSITNIIGLNPYLFKLMHQKHLILYGIGFLAAVFVNHRGYMPFVLVALLDMDYSKLDDQTRKRAILFFIFQITMLMLFAGGR